MVRTIGYTDRSKLGGDEGSDLVYSYGTFDGSTDGNLEGEVSGEGNKLGILEGSEDRTTQVQWMVLCVDEMRT